MWELLESEGVAVRQTVSEPHEHLGKEMIKMDQLAEQLEKRQVFVVDTLSKEPEGTKYWKDIEQQREIHRAAGGCVHLLRAAQHSA